MKRIGLIGAVLVIVVGLGFVDWKLSYGPVTWIAVNRCANGITSKSGLKSVAWNICLDAHKAGEVPLNGGSRGSVLDCDFEEPVGAHAVFCRDEWEAQQVAQRVAAEEERREYCTPRGHAGVPIDC